MPQPLCTTYDSDGQRHIEETSTLLAWMNGFWAWVDIGLDWATERLDRKFVSAMERCIDETPDKTREMRLLKRTVFIIVCIGLVATAAYIKFSTETQIACAIFG